MILKTVLITFIACVLTTGIGGVISVLAGGEKGSETGGLLSLAGGIMLGVVFFNLMPSALESGLPVTAAGVLAGYFFVSLLDRFTGKLATSHTKRGSAITDKRLFAGGVTLAIAVAVHNFPEGIAVGASITGGSGIAASAVIGMHDIPEGMAIALPLISSGVSKTRAILIAGLTGIPSVIGGVIGCAVGMISPLLLSLSLAFAAGAMLCVVIGELLPEAARMRTARTSSFWTLCGVLASLLINGG